MVMRAALTLLVATACSAPGQDEKPVDFAHDVLPLIRDRCGSCHTNGKAKGDLSMDTREDLLRAEVLVPGKAADSPLLERVTSADPEERMPPKGPPLSNAQVVILRRWIDQGARWEEGFSFAKAGAGLPLKPRKPELPPIAGGRENPVDRIVGAYLAARKVDTSAPLEDAAFLRRASLDLVGLLPTPERLAKFQEDRRPDKRQRLAAELLADDQAYAEHWLTFWNDLLRNDYQGTGYIDGGRKAITGWLYAALRGNKAYDQFIRELISPTAESEGFIKGIKWRGVVNASQVPELQFAQNVGQVFLGVNLKCASCHDSFIDSWKLEDTYGLAAVIADAPMEMYRCDKPLGAKASAKFLFPELGSIDPGRPKEERLRDVAGFLTSPANGLVPRTIVNRLWHRLMGRGIVHPVDVMGNEPWNADLLDFLAADLVEHGYDLKRTLGLIVTSRAYQSVPVPMEGVVPDSEFVFRGPIARRMTAEQFLDAIWQITGTAPGKSAVPLPRDGRPVRAALVESSPLMRSLGRPNREQVVTTRPDDLSTLQALELTNGQPFADLVEQGASHLRGAHPGWDADQFAREIYLAALGRQPNAQESALSRGLAGSPVTDEGLGDLLWSVFMLPEFQIIR